MRVLYITLMLLDYCYMCACLICFHCDIAPFYFSEVCAPEPGTGRSDSLRLGPPQARERRGTSARRDKEAWGRRKNSAKAHRMACNQLCGIPKTSENSSATSGRRPVCLLQQEGVKLCDEGAHAEPVELADICSAKTQAFEHPSEGGRNLDSP
ncbi:unnamed protein product [Symbiodinium natans]|uniref:Uncharacterized protein n=1 Tax=Symbiodinium natans TaxID=878477 RepID=A0A812PY90_9DINO|nr:unnamed protein product [Symbiodinium natans]